MSNIGNFDPFNKAKLADEAKKDQEMISLAKRQRDKSVLQMQTSNRKKELERAQMELRSKETKLSLLKSDILVSKRLLVSIRAELQKEENAVSSGANSLTAEAEAKNSSQKNLDNIKTKIENLSREEVTLKSEVQRKKKELEDLERKSVESKTLEAKLKQELFKTEGQVRISEQSSLVTKKQTEAKRKKIEELKNKLLEQERLETKVVADEKIISTDVAKLKNEINIKEREIADLTFKINQIK